MLLLLTTLLALLLPFTFGASDSSAPVLSTVSVLLWPPSAPSPAPYVDISYALPESTAQITKRHPLPALNADDDFIRLGFLRPDLLDGSSRDNTEAAWAGIAVPPSSIAADHNVTVELLVSRKGALYHLGLRSDKAPAPKVTKKDQPIQTQEGYVRAAVKRDQLGNKPVLNRPVVLNKEGKLEGAQEDTRSFLAKYWWAIAIFLVMQVMVGGGGDSK
ncbi:hypothetical protein ANO11243_085940 [Dothideomycetidae sp. 11243]|nr:hypothetical protein ANO11243_085940 [fungal sp. No.11243]